MPFICTVIGITVPKTLQKERLNILGNRAFNVGVDVNNYFPVSIKTIISHMLGRLSKWESR